LEERLFTKLYSQSWSFHSSLAFIENAAHIYGISESGNSWNGNWLPYYAFSLL